MYAIRSYYAPMEFIQKLLENNSTEAFAIGVAYGPWAGLLAGFIGNTLGDALSGWGFYWNWSLGNGLMGLVAGSYNFV